MVWLDRIVKVDNVKVLIVDIFFFGGMIYGGEMIYKVLC